MVLGVLHPLVCLHTSLTQRLRALYTVAGGRGIILTASAALLGKQRVKKKQNHQIGAYLHLKNHNLN